MKLSFAVSIKKIQTKNNAQYYYYSDNPNDNLSKILDYLTKYEYDGIELSIKNPEEINSNHLIKLFHNFPIAVSALATGRAYTEEGICFSHPNPLMRKKASERIKQHINLAAKLKTKVIIGLIRGNITILPQQLRSQSGVWERVNWYGTGMPVPYNKQGISKPESSEKQTKQYTTILNEISNCAKYASKKNVELLIEPINRYETNFINTIDEAIEFIKKLDKDNCKMLIDTFHMNIEEKSIYMSIEKSHSYLGYVHISDSNRLSPGSGHLNFGKIFKTLDKLNYQGFISAELLPSSNLFDSIEKTAKYVKKTIFTARGRAYTA